MEIMVGVLVLILVASFYFVVKVKKTKHNTSLVSQADIGLDLKNLDIILQEVHFSEVEKDVPIAQPNSSSNLVFGLVNSIPSLLNQKSGTYILKFSANVTQGLETGKYSLMEGTKGIYAVAIDKNGKIIEHATLSPDKFLQAVSGVAFGWQILAIITSQKFLLDINQKLAFLEEELKSIKSWLKSQEDGKYEGDLRYLKEIILVVQENGMKAISSEQLHRVEAIYHESLRSIETHKRYAESNINQISQIKFNGNVKENQAKFERIAEDYYHSRSSQIKFNYLCALAEYLLTSLDGALRLSTVRRDAILGESNGHSNAVANDVKILKKSISSFEMGFFDDQDDLNKAVKSIDENLIRFSNLSQKSNKRISEIIYSSDSLRETSASIKNGGAEFKVVVDENGNITRYYESKAS